MDSMKFYIILFSLTPCILGQCTKETAEKYFRRSVYDFSIDLTQRISTESDYHFIASTLSPWTVIAVLSSVAGGNTYKDIKQALGLHTQSCFNNKMYNIIKDIESTDEGATLQKSANIFIDETVSVKENFFIDTAKTGLLSQIESLNFEDVETVADKINFYVRSATNGAINEIVSSEELNQVQLILIGAIYFKGSWATKFDELNTQYTDFYGSDGHTKIGGVDMMFTTTAAKSAHIEILNSEVLELPYDSVKFSFLIFLPLQTISVSDVIENMKLVTLNSIFHILDKREPEAINVYLPKFNMTSDLDNLKELLSDMNLRSLFDTTANFQGITDEPLYVSNFVQKASIIVNEFGTEASAATEALLSFRSIPDEFKANRPFFFMIVDRQRQMPIFTGAYSQPSVLYF